MSFRKGQLQETLIYLVLWGLLFTAPILTLHIREHSDSTLAFDWQEVLIVWRQIGVYFAIFLIHNHLLAPMLIYRQRKVLYASTLVLLVSFFTVYQCSNRPADMADHRPAPMMRDDGQRPPLPPDFDKHGRPPFDDNRQPRFDNNRQPPFHDKGPHDNHPPVFFGEHDIVSVIVLLLMLGANLGIKLYIKQRQDHEQMEIIERKNLEQQLEYLKYQLNPHFLMNTLNNIHALVDIDSQQAQETIIKLSHILRYVLYESNHKRVPLQKEKEFMRAYTDLMRLRYGKKLTFTVDEPDNAGSVCVAPLLFISFVENAFKHGVSYQEPSFIAISGRRYTDDNKQERLRWVCRNSKHKKQEQSAVPRQGGVGMANVRQRLDLIYGSDYSLKVNETNDTYEVELDIPTETA